ncbi:hypothetical protein DAPPUDRAFT_115985 [Daphnia pulex]|uniref:Uncharacterized protein n=1 Tax=Daphnia pulex TaxID=6669 RepID=E9HN65_DAPPU|nr:hypothetical protein DAPPUDRAFT_115985 [Daphnia pulex]|eukprot:EFX66826.1 hypothetical protein DAPPUDRAFT_115985 [Daphnia pulex]
MSAQYLTDANRGIPSHDGASTRGADAYAQHTNSPTPSLVSATLPSNDNITMHQSPENYSSRVEQGFSQSSYYSNTFARRDGTSHFIPNPVAPISQNEGFVSCKEFQVIIQGIARMTVLSQDISNQLKVISTRLSKLEEERGTMETSDDLTMPKFPLETLQDFDIFEAKLKDEAFKKAFCFSVARKRMDPIRIEELFYLLLIHKIPSHNALARGPLCRADDKSK